MASQAFTGQMQPFRFVWVLLSATTAHVASSLRLRD